MKQVAIYGKGGIGKSTASANISYLLSKEGLKVVQIGCDPKHDSTRLLLGGKTQVTILDYLGSESEGDESNVIAKGKNGVICMETGGPEPGVGCAGRGILTAFDFIKEKSIVPKDTDVVIYDVLGDVVCGGFAVPLRKQYANVVFIVTSGEFMSLYAANNVLKGIRNFDNGDSRLAGLILNSRGNENEYEYVKNFADAVGLPIVAVIPRSKLFSTAESNGMTVSEMFPDSNETNSYKAVVTAIERELKGNTSLHPANPLNDDDLDLVAKGIRVRPKEFSHNTRVLATTERSALRSCGIRVVSNCCLSILDADLVVHGPMSCAHYYSSAYDRRILNEGRTELKSVNYRTFPTCLDDHASIFGGGKMLASVVEKRAASGTRLIFVITACVPGIIGDDTENICMEIEKKHPGTRIVPIPMDGILCGGGIQAMNMAIERICGLADPDVEPCKDLVNIIGYAESDDRILNASDETERILKAVGLRINCKFLHRNKSEEIIGFRRGMMNVLFSSGMTINHQAGIVKKATGVGFYREPLPRGLAQTEGWIRRFVKSQGCDPGPAESLITEMKKEYLEGMEPLKSRFEGTTSIIYIDTSADIEWLLETLEAMGVKTLEILCPTNSKWNMSDCDLKTSRDVPVLYDKNVGDLEAEIESLKPTFAIGTNYTLSSLKTLHMVVEPPRPGVKSCMEIARRIARMIEVSRYELN